MMGKIKNIFSSVLIVLLWSVSSMYGQQVPFKERTSSKAQAPFKDVKNYHLQGDFVMLGNANLAFTSSKQRNDSSSNNQTFSVSYVDIDGDNSTKNSSSAELKLGNLDPTCSEIIYAGLYWTGKADETTTNEIKVGSKTYKKNQVKFRKGTGSYVTVTAEGNGTQIHYPGSSQSGIYVGYADVTDYVKAQGVGDYFVADIALNEGIGRTTGYFGGWGMVVIYKNPAMKWQDITVFDGYAYISSGQNSFNISGFKAVQNGDVNIKMGIMSGEGDKKSGDYIEIKKSSSGTYTRLSHSLNATSNFFNSSINTGGNARNPSYTNNAGIDISMFDLPNTNNSIINNNETSTTFRYGTNGDYYSIYSVVFAVDAYVPEVIGENTPANNSFSYAGEVTPGQELEFELKMFNKGDEPVKDLKVEIPIPFNMHYNGSSIVVGSHNSIKIPNNTTVTWLPPVGAAAGATYQNTLGGTLVWNIGNLPKDDTKARLQGTLKYKFKATDNCAFLATAQACALEVNLNGQITATGTISGTKITSQFIRSYGSGACSGPNYDDFRVNISVDDAFLQGCALPIENKILKFYALCSIVDNEFSRATVSDMYPPGTKFFNQIPSSYNSTTGVVLGNFKVDEHGQKTLYYAMVPGMNAGCYVTLETQVAFIQSVPSVSDLIVCSGQNIALQVTRSALGVANNYSLFYFEDQTIQTPLSQEPAPSTLGVHTFWVAEGKDFNSTLCTGTRVKFTITVLAQPVVDQQVKAVVLCENNDYSFTVSATDAMSYRWEYATAGTPQVWQTLDNTTFSNVISVQQNTMTISHASQGIDSIQVRLVGENQAQCESSSNAISISLEDCQGMFNPMLPSKTLN